MGEGGAGLDHCLTSGSVLSQLVDVTVVNNYPFFTLTRAHHCLSFCFLKSFRSLLSLSLSLEMVAVVDSYQTNLLIKLSCLINNLVK